MWTRSTLVLAIMFAGGATLAAQSPRFGVGRPPTPDEVRGLGAAIAPDGGGLPDGSGTVLEGRTVYAARCASCHGPSGEGGGVGGALVGGKGSSDGRGDQFDIGSTLAWRSGPGLSFAPQTTPPPPATAGVS